MSINNKALVVQANQIIEARYKLSLEEQRLIKILISMIEPDDEDTKIYSIKATEVAELLGITNDHIYHTLNQVTTRLLKQILFIKKDDGYLKVTWLSSAEYLKGGIIELEISQKLRPYLLQLKEHFTKYQLRQIAKLKSGFSIRIYELCKCYEYKGGFSIKIEDLKRMFGLEDKYKLYGDFKRYVLIAAKEEINATTDINIDFSEIKSGKKVDAIQLSVIAKIKNQDIDNVKRIDAGLEKPAQEKSPVANSVINQLVSMGVSTLVAEQLVQGYDEARIKAAIAYTEAQQKEGKVKNVAGFLVKAIKNEYRDNQAEERERKQKEKKARTDKEAEIKAAQEKIAELKKQAIDSFIASLDQEQLAAIEKEFLEIMKDDIAVMKSFKKNGMGSPLVRGHFREYIFNTRCSR